MNSITLEAKTLKRTNVLSAHKERRISLCLMDLEDKPISDALVLFDHKIYHSNLRGYLEIKSDLKMNMGSGLSVLSYSVKDINYDGKEGLFKIRCKKLNPSRQEHVFLNIYSNIENENLINKKAIAELNQNLDKIKFPSQQPYSEQDKIVQSFINALKRQLSEKETLLSNFKKENQVIDYSLQKESLVYILSSLILLLLSIGLIAVVRRSYIQRKKVENVKNELDSAMTQVNDQNIKIKNSLRAAHTIQTAILPPIELLKSKFSNFFSIYRPKDIVSGDFYWYAETRNQEGLLIKFFALVDCTGHGVPGALMSMIGKSILQEIIDKNMSRDPATILKILDERVIAYLRQQENTVNDGMELAICKFVEPEQEGHTPLLYFAGAKSDLYIVNKKEHSLERYRGNRASIGGTIKNSKVFQTQQIKINYGDLLLLITDGILDQNNHENEKLGRKYFERYVKNNLDQPLKDLGDLLEAALDVHQGTVPQRDDITFIGIEV
ncbi:PP2C family protein-serine/threonine phosphatase [Flammeovirga kamogawensis]|uniref:SpoIIE family protein phosphatase n=1 Tax=Flammeovirga kamogawensis TaxID=373891 RepID=A0ABX8GYM0_9BACT|nr:SpoIIE family protein phosphatase [Flammeovirga kamogawensis]MBB6458932.1 serine phosphatase RsbU (regulator of sigma subunit) [Flammeovirga kamogawensis]QWG08508.1 SpoIIE family protein phosphatase [Flammeovirga kamogawensis]